MNPKNRVLLRFQLIFFILAMLCVSLPGLTHAEYTGVAFPPKPGDREFIVDEAGMLDDDQETEIWTDLDQLLTDQAIPIIIVTIPSLAEYDARGMRIETYAKFLFDEWGIGYEKLSVSGRGVGRSEEVSWNRGILLLVSEGDRKARIELGADYGTEKNPFTQQIMDQNIIPYFKKGDFAAGIASGAKALEAMAREEEIPVPPRPAWHYLVFFGVIGLGIFTMVSLVRRGTSGWAWVFWGFVFAGVGWILYMLLMSRGRGGGGFGGGSFGGGFSGGGGATGSW